MGFFEPKVPPASSMARLEITSFAFMFDCVPLPVCHTTSGKCASSAPAMTSSAARTMSSHLVASSLPRSLFASAAAFFTIPKARMTGRPKRWPPILKFWRLRCVCAPQYLSAPTSIWPMLSDSMRTFMVPALLGGFGPFVTRRRRRRQRERERAALIDRARHLDVAALEQRERLRDREPEAGTVAGRPAGVGGVVEDRRQAVGGNAPAGVGDGDPRPAALRWLDALDTQRDAPLGVRELDGVGDELGHDLNEPRPVADGEQRPGRNVDLELDVSLPGFRFEPGDRTLEDGDDVPRPEVEGDPPGLELREVVKIADDLAHTIRRPNDGFDHTLGRRIFGRDRLAEEPGAHHDRRERVFEIVAGDRDEVSLGRTLLFQACEPLLEVADELHRDERFSGVQRFGRSRGGETSERAAKGDDERARFGHPVRTLPLFYVVSPEPPRRRGKMARANDAPAQAGWCMPSSSRVKPVVGAARWRRGRGARARGRRGARGWRFGAGSHRVATHRRKLKPRAPLRSS